MTKERIYILGCGAIGLTLAAYLAERESRVIAVRTSRADVPAGIIHITVHRGPGVERTVPVETISLSRLAALDGIIVVTAKSYANASIASALADKVVMGPLVILQNGIGVERAFLGLGVAHIFRCVLYTTSQTIAENQVQFRPIRSSPIGVVRGGEPYLEKCVDALTTPDFPFHVEREIQRDIWKKAISNAVFNSICPLLEMDNGIFARDPAVADLAREIIGECVGLAETQGIMLTEPELLDQLMAISKGSDGQWISTLQDIKKGRETEIEYLNLEMARLAAKSGILFHRTAFLGGMILAKSGVEKEGRGKGG